MPDKKMVSPLQRKPFFNTYKIERIKDSKGRAEEWKKSNEDWKRNL